MYFKNLNILVGLDARESTAWVLKPEFSEASVRALQAAVSLVSGGRGRLTLMFTGAVSTGLSGLTSMDLGEHADQAAIRQRLEASWQGQLEALAWAEIPEDVPRVLLTGTRPPASALLDRLAEGEHRMVALGGSTKTGVALEVLGSVTERVLRETTVPALVAGLEPPPRPLSTTPEVLVCLDFSETSHRALRAAISLVRAHGGGLTVLSVDPVPAFATPSYTGGELNPLRRQLLDWSRGRSRVLGGRVEKLLKTEVPADVPYEVVVREGSPSVAILEQVKAGDFDLVALGITGRSGHAPGTTARRVMRGSETAMLLCP